MATLTDSQNAATGRSAGSPAAFIELKCRTNYSFLRGASQPSEIIARAAALNLPAVGIADRNGVYGIPKAYLALKDHPSVRLITGAEVILADALPPITFLARDRKGYGLLCRMLTAAHADKPKGEARLTWAELTDFLSRPESRGLIALPEPAPFDSESGLGLDYGALSDLLKDRLYLPLWRHLDEGGAGRTEQALALSHRYNAPIVATNDVHYHAPERRRLQDVLTATREGVALKRGGHRFFSNAERYMKSPRQMKNLFRDLPEALSNTLEAAERCTFSPSELRYRYPSEWIPALHTAQSYLTQLTWEGAEGRYPAGIPSDVRAQLEHELRLIESLAFADYFLTIWEIVDYARSKKILCQGRGSAANSAVCYCLGITAIDPVRMNLLFERFLSAERGEPPDIDVDFEHERREEVIQHIYAKYGRDRAAMVSAVVTYRGRSAIREVTKAFGIETDKRDYDKQNNEQKNEPAPARGSAQPSRAVMDTLIDELKGFPRHLSIHSGGFTLSADPIIETVPVEPARMEGRTIVQWDKYDLDALGLLKVDVLSLGMLTALRKSMDLIEGTGGPRLTLATIPADDPTTYRMIREADTIGTFQIESRAQMSMLPRLKPVTFYDLVIQVAIVRPGPIVGKMVHPYLRRRRGQEFVDIPHPKLEPILRRTLGVPLFQEQVMQMAIALGGFTPGEADELRRAIGAWRSSGSIDKMGQKLMKGLMANGIPQEFADRIFMQIHGFAEYGFPESHAASFALLAYASAYLKRHHPAEFTCALLNSQPMGFYNAHSLIDDLKRHGHRVLPLDVNLSQWDCTLEPDGVKGSALRLGFRYLSGIRQDEANQMIAAREERRFSSLEDFLSRAHVRSSMLHRLALGDAFSVFGLDQRKALWRILAANQQLPLFSGHELGESARPSPFRALDTYESICADYTVFNLSARGHPMEEIRKRFPRLPRTTTATARATPSGRRLEVAGLSIVMQRPPTAGGTVFATLEDETGILDLILHKDVFERYREMILEHCFLIATGAIQRDGDSISLIVKSVRPFGVDFSQESAPRPQLSPGVTGG